MTLYEALSVCGGFLLLFVTLGGVLWQVRSVKLQSETAQTAQADKLVTDAVEGERLRNREHIEDLRTNLAEARQEAREQRARADALQATINEQALRQQRRGGA